MAKSTFIGEFDVMGNIIRPCKLFSVRRVGSLLLLEFINNTRIPLEVIKYSNELYNLSVVRSTLFKSRFVKTDCIRIYMYCDTLFNEMDVRIEVFSFDNAYIETKRDGSIVVQHGNNYTSYNTGDVSRFIWDFGIGILRGCNYNQGIALPIPMWEDYNIKVTTYGVVISLMDGVKVPIVERNGDLHLCGVSVGCSVKDMEYLFVRYFEDKGYISLGFVKEDIIICDNVRVSQNNVSYLGETLSSAEVAKQLLYIGCDKLV